MFKRMTSALLSLLLIICITMPVMANAAPRQTFEEAVNAMVLEPLRPSYWTDQDFIRRVDRVTAGLTTNYDKMLAVYRDIVNNPVRINNHLMDSSFQNTQLAAAFEVLGFRTYFMVGTNKVTNLDWQPESRIGTFRWVGVDVGSGLFYFDAYTPMVSRNHSSMFGLLHGGERAGALFEDGMYIVQREIEPLNLVNRATRISQAFALAILNPIPNTVAERSAFRNVPDAIYSLYYTPRGEYWGMVDSPLIILGPGASPPQRVTHAQETDRLGNVVRIDRQGNVTVITPTRRAG
jgi:hypothetical protein